MLENSQENFLLQSTIQSKDPDSRRTRLTKMLNIKITTITRQKYSQRKLSFVSHFKSHNQKIYIMFVMRIRTNRSIVVFDKSWHMPQHFKFWKVTLQSLQTNFQVFNCIEWTTNSHLVILYYFWSTEMIEQRLIYSKISWIYLSLLV